MGGIKSQANLFSVRLLYPFDSTYQLAVQHSTQFLWKRSKVRPRAIPLAGFGLQARKSVVRDDKTIGTEVQIALKRVEFFAGLNAMGRERMARPEIEPGTSPFHAGRSPN